MGGILPFGALFIEMLYVMNAIWRSQIYYVFGFLLVVFLVLVATTCLVSIMVTYFALCGENYNWWWRSYFAGASCGFYMFLYSIFYYFTKLEFRDWASTIIYISWNLVMSGGVAVLLGTAGFLSSLLFVRKIYRSIKID